MSIGGAAETPDELEIGMAPFRREPEEWPRYETQFERELQMMNRLAALDPPKQAPQPRGARNMMSELAEKNHAAVLQRQGCKDPEYGVYLYQRSGLSWQQFLTQAPKQYPSLFPTTQQRLRDEIRAQIDKRFGVAGSPEERRAAVAKMSIPDYAAYLRKLGIETDRSR